MAYEYSRNNNNNNVKRSVSTSGQKYVNGNMKKPCALQISYWDDFVKISFVPELPEAERTMNRRYDYDHPIETSLVRVKVNMLVKYYKEKIIPAIKECRDESISVTVASVNQLQIATNIIDGVPHPVVRLIKDINETTLMADSATIMEYEFNLTEIILGYDSNTGKYTERVLDYGELELFMHDLESAVEASSNAYVHTDRVVKRYMNDRLDNKINQIGTKLGLNLETKRQYTSGGNGGQGSIFDKPSSSQDSNGYQVPNDSVGSIDELNSIIGD